MDQSRFQEAQRAYEAGEFRTAAKGFLASASRGPDGNGSAYHMAGNSLLRLRRYQDAVTVYGHALRDSVYDKRGAVWANLGSAYTALGDYAEAARSYENALEEPDYRTPYKAYQGMAGALLERGKIEEAAIAYRKAALDPGNPDPGRALVNLGLCFMGLARPADAVEAYQAALGFDQYKGRGKALANLGQAYVALGEYGEAVKSFEKAIGLHNHKLSAAAEAAYATARTQVAATAPAPQAQPDDSGATMGMAAVGAGAAGALLGTAARPRAGATDEFGLPAPGSVSPEHDVIDGWETGQIPAADLRYADPTGTWNVGDLAAVNLGADAAAVSQPSHGIVDYGSELSASPLAPFDQHDPSAQLGIGDDAAVADFFSATDEELKARDKASRRAQRHERGPWAVWRPVLILVLVVALAAAGLFAAFQTGYGWPTQEQSVEGMLSAYQGGTPVTKYWVGAPTKDVAKEMAKIPPVKSFAIDQVERGATTSVVAITVTPKSGAPLHYKVNLSREGVAWKVNGIDNDWSTTGG